MARKNRFRLGARSVGEMVDCSSVSPMTVEETLLEMASILNSLPPGEHWIRVRVSLEDTWTTLFNAKGGDDAERGQAALPPSEGPMGG